MGCTMALSGPLVNASSLHLQIARDPASSATYEYAVQDNVNIYGSGGIFAGNGAPTLIVAFLAIGIFTVATAVAFSWKRRLDAQRVVGPTGRLAQTRRRKPATVRVKPILWDMWTQTRGSIGDSASQENMWENIAPLAAVLKSNLVDPATTPTTQERRPSGDTAVLRAVLSTVKRHYQAPSPIAALSPPLPSPSPSKSQLRGRPPHLLIKRTSVQIAVTIAMPTLSTPVPSRNATVLGESEFVSANEELVEFCIGTMEIPLREG